MRLTAAGTVLTCALLCAVLLAPAANAGEYGVSPLRVELSPSLKSAVVTVTGKSRPGQLLQVSAMRWVQDAAGADRYEETSDLVFLPKTVDLSKGGSRLIRVGIEKPVTDVEKTYRLFIRETPPPEAAGRARGAQVAVVVDFALPVFVLPAKVAPRAELQDVKVEKGVLSVMVANTGNVRLNLASLSAGKAQFKDFRGWYLLSGASRRYSTTLPAAACAGPLAVQLRTATLNVKRDITVTPEMCKG